MKISLPNNRWARLNVRFGDSSPHLSRQIYTDAQIKQFRSVQITVKVHDNAELQGEPIAEFAGESYCSPLDQFERFTGRKIAMRRLVIQAGDSLTKDDRRILYDAILVVKAR